MPELPGINFQRMDDLSVVLAAAGDAAADHAARRPL
jgi:hypothetical protein